MRIERIVLGTGNKAKFNEWKKIFAEEALGIVIGDDALKLANPTETGESFEENASLKAQHYAKLLHEYVMGDDGGYEIDILGGAPGVKSKRILPGGVEGSDDQIIDFVLEKTKGLPKEKRGVSLTSAIALSTPEGKIIYLDKEEFRGLIAERRGPISIPGYPFRTIHFLPELGKTYAELTEEEHTKYSHKRKLARRFARFLLE